MFGRGFYACSHVLLHAPCQLFFLPLCPSIHCSFLPSHPSYTHTHKTHTQGTNAHAITEVVDSQQLPPASSCLFDNSGCNDSSNRLAPRWQRTPFWLLPPPSALLTSCTILGGGGGGSRALFQGELRRPALAGLLHGSGGGNGAWALAAEAAYAAAALLSATYDGLRRRRRHGLAAAAFSAGSAAADATASLQGSGRTLLTAAVDCRCGGGGVTVSASGGGSLPAEYSQLLSASLFSISELQRPARSTAQQLQHEQLSAAACRHAWFGLAAKYPSSHQQALTISESATTVVADVAAAPAQQAQQVQGLFLQPALLQGSTQLHLLAATLSQPPQALPLQQGSPATADCLAPAEAAHSTAGSFQAASSSKFGTSTAWHASACRRSARLRCRGGGGGGLCLSGITFAGRSPPAGPSCGTLTCGGTAVPSRTSISYTTAWQVLQPACLLISSQPAANESAAAVSQPSQRLRSPAAAVLVVEWQQQGRQPSRQPASCHIPLLPAGSSMDAGQAACLQAMQLLQVAAASGACSLSLTALGQGGCTGSCAPASSSAATMQAALFAMLRCAASELPAVRCSAGSVAESAVPSDSTAAVPWDPSFACQGQQMAAGVHVAARLLPVSGGDASAPADLALAASRTMLDSSLFLRQQWAVSGGTGALGLLSAGWLQHGLAAGVTLLGRSGRLSTGAVHAVLQRPAADGIPQSAGCCVSIAICDVAMRADAPAALNATSGAASGVPAAAGQLPCSAILHAGGILQDALLPRQTDASIRAVHAPKTAGLRRLLGSAAGTASPLQRVVLFSSIAAVTGPAGSTNYAAANGALDAAADRLQLRGGWWVLGAGWLGWQAGLFWLGCFGWVLSGADAAFPWLLSACMHACMPLLVLALAHRSGSCSPVLICTLHPASCILTSHSPCTKRTYFASKHFFQHPCFTTSHSPCTSANGHTCLQTFICQKHPCFTSHSPACPSSPLLSTCCRLCRQQRAVGRLGRCGHGGRQCSGPPGNVPLRPGHGVAGTRPGSHAAAAGQCRRSSAATAGRHSL